MAGKTQLPKTSALIFAIGITFFLMGLASFRSSQKPGLPPPASPSPSPGYTPSAVTASPSASVKGAQVEEALVTRVIDGDTIELSDSRHVRYIGINTPETVHPTKPVECYGHEASAENKRLVEGKSVLLEKDISETDRYGRLLRYVWLGDAFINDYLVRQGFAQVSTFPPDVKYEEQFLAAQTEARQNNRGLWSACVSGVAPLGTSPATFSATSFPSASPGCLIKGNISLSGEKIYHLPGCGSYDKTAIDTNTGERWFCSEEEAVTAGWRKAKNCP